MFFRKRERPVAPLVYASDDDFEELVERRAGVTLVDFWAPWCAPCRMMEPILSEVSIENAESGITVVKVNVDQAPDTANRFGIRSIPTLVFFQDGEALFEMVGLVPKPVLERELKALATP